MNRVPVAVLALLVAFQGRLGADGHSVEDMKQQAEQMSNRRHHVEECLVREVKSGGTDPASLKQRKTAILLLGDVGSAYCVPTLIEFMFKYFTPEAEATGDASWVEHGDVEPTPSMLSLSKLGPVAALPLLDSVCTETHPVLVSTKIQALMMLPCKELLTAIVERRARVEKDPVAVRTLNTLHTFLTHEPLPK